MAEKVAERDTSATLDRVGATASLICAVHCAIMPLVITLLPLVGLSFLADERIEWALVAVSALMGITSLCLGFKEHGSRRAFAFLGIGLGMLTTGRVLEGHVHSAWGWPIVVLGGITLATAHFINRRLCMSCRSCQTHHH